MNRETAGRLLQLSNGCRCLEQGGSSGSEVVRFCAYFQGTPSRICWQLDVGFARKRTPSFMT